MNDRSATITPLALILCEDERLYRLLEIELSRSGFHTLHPEDANDTTIPDLLVEVAPLSFPSPRVFCPRLIIGRDMTARGDTSDTVSTTRYLPRPFSLMALEDALRALSLRQGRSIVAPAAITSPAVLPAPPAELATANITLEDRAVLIDGRRFSLSPAEHVILAHLCAHRGELVLRADLSALLSGGSNSVDVYIHHLRRKLERPLARRLIESIRGQGYRLL